jgi:hypothetical protein
MIGVAGGKNVSMIRPKNLLPKMRERTNPLVQVNIGTFGVIRESKNAGARVLDMILPFQGALVRIPVSA